MTALEQAAVRYAVARQAYLELHEENVQAEEAWHAAAAAANHAHKAMKAAEERMLHVAATEPALPASEGE